MQEQLNKILEEAKAQLREAKTHAQTDEIRVRFLGKKGELTGILRGMGKLSPEERKTTGQMANEVRSQIEGMLNEKFEQVKAAAKEAQFKKEKIDVTEPGKIRGLGVKHPLTITMDEISRVFRNMGYSIVEGPEVETVFNNFDALNAGPNHPARDMTDTFYITEDVLLRTQTSPVQVRTLLSQKPPIKVISPGRVFRCDTPDATHSPMFHQVEGLLVDEGVTMADLKGTFKVNARRSDKRYFMTSPAINAEMGGRILEANPELKVDIHNPDHVLNVEIRDQAYLYVKVIPAVGGMPVGTNGNATLLLSGGIDSPVAGWMIAKRGVQINAVHFHSYPYTSEQAKEKVLDLARKLSFSCCGIKVYIVPFTEIQLQIRDHCPEEYTTLIMRRFMMRIAERIAEKTGSGALITGESIGQVASQTMEALQTTDSVVSMPVFRPLIGFDKSEIIEIARKIDTYELSSLPYEDCCTIFTPKHPATRPRKEKVEEAEQALDAGPLIEAALDGTEVIQV